MAALGGGKSVESVEQDNIVVLESIHRQLLEQRVHGVAILLISTEMDLFWQVFTKTTSTAGTPAFLWPLCAGPFA